MAVARMRKIANRKYKAVCAHRWASASCDDKTIVHTATATPHSICKHPPAIAIPTAIDLKFPQPLLVEY